MTKDPGGGSINSVRTIFRSQGGEGSLTLIRIWLVGSGGKNVEVPCSGELRWLLDDPLSSQTVQSSLKSGDNPESLLEMVITNAVVTRS